MSEPITRIRTTSFIRNPRAGRVSLSGKATAGKIGLLLLRQRAEHRLAADRHGSAWRGQAATLYLRRVQAIRLVRAIDDLRRLASRPADSHAQPRRRSDDLQQHN